MRNRPGLQLIVAFSLALAVVTVSHAFGTGLPGPQGGGGVTVSTGLSDSANLARLNVANSFTKAPQTITASADTEVPLIARAGGSGYSAVDLQQWKRGDGVLQTRVGLLGNFNVIDGSGADKAYAIRKSDDTTELAYFGLAGLQVNNTQRIYFGASATVDGTYTAIFGIVASGRQAAVSAVAATSIATYTPSADGSFVVTGNVLVTTAGTIAATMTVTYTDEGNTSRTATLPFTLVAGAPLTAINFANGTVPYEGVPLRIRAKASTAITVQTAGTFTSSVYNCEADIVQVK